MLEEMQRQGNFDISIELKRIKVMLDNVKDFANCKYDFIKSS